MELHIQKCQHCGSRELRNILVRSEQQKVFVQCRHCSQLVARYLLGNGGYYHAGKDFESFLRSIERDQGTTSGRNLHAEYTELSQKIEDEFKQVVEQANTRYDGLLP